MKFLNYSVLALLSISIISCGLSKEELAKKEQARIDSIKKATEDSIHRQQALNDSIQAALAEDALAQEANKEQLIDLKSQLAAEESKMESIQQWKLGRTEDEKAQQIGDQTKVIESLKMQISDLEKKIQ